jgi:DhnA family fructose-bisphosphate aldolase class Ia
VVRLVLVARAGAAVVRVLRQRQHQQQLVGLVLQEVFMGAVAVAVAVHLGQLQTQQAMAVLGAMAQ